MGSKNLCRDCSVIFGDCVLRSVNSSSSDNLKPISIYRLLVTWLVPIAGTSTFVQGILMTTTWGITVSTTSFAASMAVNALVTGLIVFKILEVSLEVSRSLGSITGRDSKFRHIIFVIIESGMLMFAAQLVRVVLFNLPAAPLQGNDIVTGFSEMFNVIIRSVFFFFFFFTDNIYLATRASHQQ